MGELIRHIENLVVHLLHHVAGGLASTRHAKPNANIVSIAWFDEGVALEPPRDCRRPFGLSYAAMAVSSSMA